METVAENLSDGVIAPLVFTALGGAAGGYFYKTVNTMDSMVGYRNDRYRYFGTGAARLDDVCNFLPARLTALLMILLSGVWCLEPPGSLAVFRRDRYCHASPNSAQTESAMAGALGIQLGGDAWYFGQLHKRRPSATACGRWNLRHSQCDHADDGGQRCGRGLGGDTFWHGLRPKRMKIELEHVLPADIERGALPSFPKSWGPGPTGDLMKKGS